MRWPSPAPESWYRWQLYDLEADPGETQDVSAEHPQIVRELESTWDAYATENNVVRDARVRLPFA